MAEGAILDQFYKCSETLHAVLRLSRASCCNHRSYYYSHWFSQFYFIALQFY